MTLSNIPASKEDVFRDEYHGLNQVGLLLFPRVGEGSGRVLNTIIWVQFSFAAGRKGMGSVRKASAMVATSWLRSAYSNKCSVVYRKGRRSECFIAMRSPVMPGTAMEARIQDKKASKEGQKAVSKTRVDISLQLLAMTRNG